MVLSETNQPIKQMDKETIEYWIRVLCVTILHSKGMYIADAMDALDVIEDKLLLGEEKKGKKPFPKEWEKTVKPFPKFPRRKKR